MKLNQLPYPVAFAALIGALALPNYHRASAAPSGQVEKQITAFGPQIAEKLAPTSTFIQTSSGYQVQAPKPKMPAGLKPQEAQAWLAFVDRHAAESGALNPLFPATYSQGTRVHAQGMTVTLRPLGSTAATGSVENGKLVYHQTYASTDSLEVVAQGRSEEFLLLHDSKAPQRFEYELTGVQGVKNISLKEDGAIHFQNSKGQDLRVEAPWLVEATASTVKPASLKKNIHWELTAAKGGNEWPTLALVLDNPKSLHYPLVIDPTWSTTQGQLNEGRNDFVSVLLNNGKVLIAGGQLYYSSFLASAELYDPATGIWSYTGSLNVARDDAAAALLPNGKVLICGGTDGPDYLSSCELYDSATGTWSYTGSMNEARTGHNVTRLADGRILTECGYNSTDSLATAELYDSTTGTWSPTGSTSTYRSNYTTTVLPNGQVLLAGGRDFSGARTGAELYNPSTGIWSATGSLNIARSNFAATLLTDGRVLVEGGVNTGYTRLSSAELYNSSTGTWTTTNPLSTARNGHQSTLLPNGQVLVAGGNNSTTAFSSTEIFNPTTNTWSSGASMNVARSAQSQTLLPSGQVLIAGGQNGSGDPSETELYDYASGTFSTTGSIPTAFDFHTATLLPSGKVLVAGGESNGNLNNATYLYDPVAGTWAATGSLQTQRDDAAAILLPNGKVLIAGGVNFDGYTTGAELYDTTTGTWTNTGSLTDDLAYETLTLLPNGIVLLAGGTDDSGATKGAELYNSATGTWTSTGSMTNARENHTATLLPNGKVLVAGGGDGTNGIAGAELYDSTTGTWTTTGSLITAREFHNANLLPNGKVLVAGGATATSGLTSAELYDSTTGTWTATGNLGTGRKYAASSVLPNGKVLVDGGLTGSTFITSAELYDPALGTWAATGSLANGRALFTQNVLLNGKVLIVGGTHDTNTATELYNTGLGAVAGTEPYVAALTSNVLLSTGTLTLTGTGFFGTALDLTGSFTDGGPSEASSGNAQAAPSNSPVVKIQSLVNEQVITLPVDPTVGFSSTTFASGALTGLPTGYALITMFVNGIPSASQPLLYLQNKLPQAINFPTVTGTFQGTSSLSASDNTGLPITFSVISGPATVDNVHSTVTFTGGGAVVLAANAAEDAINAATQVQQTVNIDKVGQTIAPFATIPDHTYGDAPFSITLPTSDSGLPVAVTVKSGSASITGSLITITGAGAVTLAANQSGDSTYNPAREVTTSFSVAQAAQTITFPAIGNQPYGSSFSTGATASSGLALTYTVSGHVKIVGNTVTVTGGGHVAIRAHQDGDSNYLPATSVVQSFDVTGAAQNITFPTITNRTYGDAPATLHATASSKLPVTYSVQSGPATISGGKAVLTGAGTVVLAADQAGDSRYAPATQATMTFNVAKASQTLSFPTIGNKVNGASFPSGATASSGLPVTYTSVGPVKIVGDIITVIGAGHVRIRVHQDGNSNYLAAPSIVQSFEATQAPQTITFPTITDRTYGDAPATLHATAASKLPVTYSVVSGPASISGGKAVLTGAGTVVLAADQAGNADYAAATRVTVTFEVKQAKQTLTFPAISDQIAGASFPSGATASSGLPVTYTSTGPVSIVGDMITVTGGGHVSIRVHQDGNADYLAADTVVQSFEATTATPTAQTIRFPTISDQGFSAEPLKLKASSTSGLPITYTVLSGPATVSGRELTMTGVGVVQLAADQPGGSGYLAATRVTTSFTISKGEQTINFPSIGGLYLTGQTITLNATSSSGLPITYSKSGPVTISGNTVRVTGVGHVVIRARQEGDANYNAATSVVQSFDTTDSIL